MSQAVDGGFFPSPVGIMVDEADVLGRIESGTHVRVLHTGNSRRSLLHSPSIASGPEEQPLPHSPSIASCPEEQHSESMDKDRPVPITARCVRTSSVFWKTHNFSSAHDIGTASNILSGTRASLQPPSTDVQDQNSIAEGKKDHTSITVEAIYSTAAEEPSLQRERRAISAKDLYHWCAISGILLVLQVIIEVWHCKFQVVPHLSAFCSLVLLSYSVGSAATIYFVNSARPYAVYLLAIGSVWMTGQTAWHCDSFVTHFKSEVLLEMPSLQNTVLHSFAFGAPPVDFLDTAALFVILFQNCVQSSCLIRQGVRVTAIVSVAQWVVIACWPLVSPNSPGWWPRIAATGLWTAHLVRSSHVWESDLERRVQLVDDLQRSVADSSKDLQDRQEADSVLNHLLKNTMADAGGCIDLVRQQTAANQDHALLSKASDFLFRGMWWCKLREAMLRMVAGRYETELVPVDLLQFTQDLARGREIGHECPRVAVELDPMVCNVVLDNALTNAQRHGCPQHPWVHLAVEVTPEDNEHLEDNAPVRVRFLVSNRANPRRPAIQTRWSSTSQEHRASVAPRKDPLRPTLSDGLGLHHIGMAARASGMVAELWQEDDEVFFKLCFSSVVKPLEATDAGAAQAARPFPSGLTILGLDDSGIARVTLETNLQSVVPNGTVSMYGKDLDEVEEFKRTALGRGDILILDENVHLPGAELQGSAILKELLEQGYDGFACIRSGNSDPSAVALSAQSGAHWHVGKEVPIPQMLRELQARYAEFQGMKAVPPECDARNSRNSPQAACPKDGPAGLAAGA